MEKKGSRSVQPLSKGLATDSKKNQDGAGGKLWPRGGRRREPTCGTLSLKNEPSRKPTPQRTKAIDKRPRTKGFYNGASTGAVARTETSRLENEHEVELGSVFLPGSKKQSLNHLLNFVYAPRDNYYADQRTDRHSKEGRSINTRKHKYNKEHFLQANCQFIVNSSGDYKQYLNNPDALVDWNLIEQVNVQVSEFPSCPICLYPPVAAKMTRCGHIYCWSCLLHYLALSDNQHRKCPICYESINKKDLKSVVPIPHATFSVNETVTFKLMKRAKGSLTAYPADAMVNDHEIIFNMSDKAASQVYSKLLLATSSDIMTIIDREHKELEHQLNEEDDPFEKCFTDQAVTCLEERKVAVLGGEIQKVALQTNENLSNYVEDKPSLTEETRDSFEIEENVEDSVIPCSSSQTTKYHYFYQAADGQHLYIHAINARMLEHTYGSLEYAPRSIIGKILEKEGGSMTEELRKRLRYLQHLPVTCQFEVAEIQLKQPVVTRETLDVFNEQIEIRRKKRQKRAKEEKRREKRIAEEINKQLGKYPEPNISLESEEQFPEFGFEPRLRTESENTFGSEESSNASGSHITPIERSGPSFAKMLASQKKPTESWPGLASSSTSTQVKLINVTGSHVPSTFTKRSEQTESDPEPEYFEPVPKLNRSFGDVIAQALQKAAHSDISLENDEPSSNGKKKKKKNKQTVLFATSMAYSGN